MLNYLPCMASYNVRILNDTIDCNPAGHGCAQKPQIVTSDLGIICDVIIVIIKRCTCSTTKRWVHHSYSISRSPPRDKWQCAKLRTT